MGRGLGIGSQSELSGLSSGLISGKSQSGLSGLISCGSQSELSGLICVYDAVECRRDKDPLIPVDCWVVSADLYCF